MMTLMDWLVRQSNLDAFVFLKSRGLSMNPRRMMGKVIKRCPPCGWRGWVNARRLACPRCKARPGSSGSSPSASAGGAGVSEWK